MSVTSITVKGKLAASPTIEVYSSENISVVPNPTTGFVEIKSPQAFERVEIYDFSGRFLFQFNDTSNHQFDFSSLAKGIYQVVLKSKDAVSSVKVVKM